MTTWIAANWKLLVALAYALLNIGNALTSNPEAKTWIGKLIDGLSFLTRSDAGGTLKMPLKLSRSPGSLKPPGASGMLPTIAAALLFPMVAACLPPLAACKAPSDPVMAAKCDLEQNLISCGEKTAIDMIPALLGLITSAIAGTFDAGALLADLESQGVANAPCVLAALEHYLMPITPQTAGKIHTTLILALKGKHLTGTVQIKLHNGVNVQAVVP